MNITSTEKIRNEEKLINIMKDQRAECKTMGGQEDITVDFRKAKEMVT